MEPSCSTREPTAAVQSAATPSGQARFPPHSLENVGRDDLLVLMVEIKDAAPAVS